MPSLRGYRLAYLFIIYNHISLSGLFPTPWSVAHRPFFYVKFRSVCHRPRLQICRKEAKESHISSEYFVFIRPEGTAELFALIVNFFRGGFLQLIDETNPTEFEKEGIELHDEAVQLKKIFSAIIEKSK